MTPDIDAEQPTDEQKRLAVLEAENAILRTRLLKQRREIDELRRAERESRY